MVHRERREVRVVLVGPQSHQEEQEGTRETPTPVGLGRVRGIANAGQRADAAAASASWVYVPAPAGMPHSFAIAIANAPRARAARTGRPEPFLPGSSRTGAALIPTAGLLMFWQHLGVTLEPGVAPELGAVPPADAFGGTGESNREVREAIALKSPTART